MGKKGSNILAPVILNILPKFELEPILIYLRILPNVFLPSVTPSTNTKRFFFKRIISADSFAISTALLREEKHSAISLNILRWAQAQTSVIC